MDGPTDWQTHRHADSCITPKHSFGVYKNLTCPLSKMLQTANVEIYLWNLRKHVGKGENAGNQHFILCPYFQMTSEGLKIHGLFGKKLNRENNKHLQLHF